MGEYSKLDLISVVIWKVDHSVFYGVTISTKIWVVG